MVRRLGQGNRELSDRWIYLLLCAMVVCLCIATVFAIPGVFAQGNVPLNGDLSNGLNYWYAGSDALPSINGGQGHNAAGSIWIQSTTFGYPVIVGANSVFSFWTKHMGCSQGGANLYDWTTNASIGIVYYNTCDQWDWTPVVYTSTIPAGHAVSFVLVGGGWPLVFDDFAVTNATNAPMQEWLNGNFSALNTRTYWMDTRTCDQWYWDGAVGNPSGSIRGREGCINTIVTKPFLISSSNWSVDHFCPSSVTDAGIRFSMNGNWFTVATLPCSGTWATKQFSMAAFVGMVGSFALDYTGHDYYSWFDNLCPSSGCTNGTPTSVPPTATSSGGGNGNNGGYATIDWSQFPTFPPYPTFPPFPTQVPYSTQLPYPTPIYGPGTAIPITGSVSITGVVKIDDATPVRVKVDDSTPVAVKIDDRTPVNVKVDDRTPVHVQFTDQRYTPVAWSEAGVQQNAPAPGAVLPTPITSPGQSHIEYGQGGSSANPLNFTMDQADLSLPSFSIPVLNVSFGILIHYYWPTAFSLAGINMLPGIYGLAAIYVLVTVIRQLQQR